MTAIKCPTCGAGTIRREVLPEYEAKLGGVSFTVTHAEVARCSNCGHVIVTAKELERWREQQKNELQAKGDVLSSDRVSGLRIAMQMSVAEFAALLAVTRQTVHAWEARGLSLGPATLLLRLLEEEQSARGMRGVFDRLLSAAKARGQLAHYVRRQTTPAGSADAAPLARQVGLARVRTKAASWFVKPSNRISSLLEPTEI